MNKSEETETIVFVKPCCYEDYRYYLEIKRNVLVDAIKEKRPDLKKKIIRRALARMNYNEDWTYTSDKDLDGQIANLINQLFFEHDETISPEHENYDPPSYINRYSIVIWDEY